MNPFDGKQTFLDMMKAMTLVLKKIKRIFLMAQKDLSISKIFLFISKFDP